MNTPNVLIPMAHMTAIVLLDSLAMALIAMTSMSAQISQKFSPQQKKVEQMHAISMLNV